MASPEGMESTDGMESADGMASTGAMPGPDGTDAKAAAILAEAKAAVDAIWDKKGFEVEMLQVGAIVQYTDYLIIASATSDRHAMAIADNVEAHLLKEHASKPIGTEGRQTGRWIIIDYSDFVVHVFHRPVREYYQLGRLYGDAPRVPLEEPAWVRETTPDAILDQAMDYGDLLWEDAAVDPSLDDDDSEQAADYDDQEDEVNADGDGDLEDGADGDGDLEDGAAAPAPAVPTTAKPS